MISGWFRRLLLILPFSIGTPALSQTPPPVFQGIVFVVGTTSQCATSRAAFVGDSFVTLYRPQIAASDPPENFVFDYQGGAAIYAPLGSTKFNTSTKMDVKIIRRDVQFTTWSDATHSIRFSPATILSTTAVVNMSGQVQNWNVSGCTVTFRGALSRKP